MTEKKSISPSRKANEFGVYTHENMQITQPQPINRGSRSPFREEFESKPHSVQESAEVQTRQPARLELQQNFVNNQKPLIILPRTAKKRAILENDGQQYNNPFKNSTPLQSEILHYMADPQIYVNFVTSKDELPRSIALERKRREIASIDFELYIKQQLDDSLAQFDDDTFTTKSFSEWQKSCRKVEIYDANECKTRQVNGLYGECYINGAWQKCVIVGQKEQKFLIFIREQNSAVKYFIPALFCFIWGENPLIYVERINNAIYQRELRDSILRYNACVENMPVEGLVEFSFELWDRLCQLAQNKAKQQTDQPEKKDGPFALASQEPAPEQTEVQQKLTDESSEKWDIINSKQTAKTQVSSVPQAHLRALTELYKEVQYNYYISQNRILFEISLQKQPSLVLELNLEKAVAYFNQEKHERYFNFRKQIEPYISLVGISKSEFGETDEEVAFNVEEYLKQKFAQTKHIIEFESFLTHKEAVKCLEICQFETQRLLNYRIQDHNYYDEPDVSAIPFDYLTYDYSLYNIITKSAQPVAPLQQKSYNCDEFKLLQQEQQKQLKSFLESDWIMGIKSELIEVLRHSGKGHFNIYVKEKQVYLDSKLRKLVLRIIYELNDTVRFLVQNSVAQFVEMFRVNSLWSVALNSSGRAVSSHPDNDYNAEDPENALTVYRYPIFNISIVIGERQAVSEEHAILDRLEATYIYGISPLSEEPEEEGFDEPEAADDAEQEGPEQNDDNMVQKIEDNRSFVGGQANQSTVNASAAQAAARPARQKEAPPAARDEVVKYLEFSHTVADFQEAVANTFDNGFKAISSIPDIEPMLLLQIVQSEKTFICPPEITEDEFKRAKAQINDYIVRLYAPLPGYLKTFTKYRELIYENEEKWAATVKYRAELFLQQERGALGAEQGEGAPSEPAGADGPQPQNEQPEDISPEMAAAVAAATPLDPAQLRALTHSLLSEAAELEREIPETSQIGAFSVKNAELRSFLVQKRERQAVAVQSIITEIASQKSSMIGDTYNQLKRRLQHKSQSIQEVCRLEAFLRAKMGAILKAMQQNIGIMNEYYNILDELLLQQPNSVVAERYRTAGYPKELDELWKETTAAIELDKQKFRELQLSEQASLSKDIDTVTRAMQGFPHKFEKLEDFEAANEEAERIQRQCQRQLERAKRINAAEQLQKMQVTDYTAFTETINGFKPIAMIWQCMSDFRVLRDKLFKEDFKFISAEKAEEIIDSSFRQLAKAQRAIIDENVKVLAETIKQEVNDFRKYLPLLSALRNPGLRKRHWIKISRDTGVDLTRLRYINGIELEQYGSKSADGDEKSDNDYADMTAEQIDDLNKMPCQFTFRQALEEYELNTPEKMQKIVAISDVAAKEFTIEQVIEELDKTWDKIAFKFARYQNSDTFVLKQLDDIIEQLDDDITMIQAMSFSPFKKHFEEAISGWEYKLSLTSEIIDIWVLVQQSWLYLEPIFSSQDIVKQLPNESRIFKTVDSFFRKFMSNAQKIGNVIKVCTETEKLLAKLHENHKQLELVQKGLSDYLETKRIAFPRFFFLSDDELLSILSNTKNPMSVQPFLRSLFENISRIKFLEEENYKMVSLTSHEGEIVQFSDPLVPQGNVEVWMNELERVVLKTIRIRIVETLSLYVDSVCQGGVEGRAEWVKCGFAQGVTLCNELSFANDAGYAITGGYLSQYLDYLNKQLDMMTELVRKGMNKLESKCFSALLTYDVFQRDVVEQLMQEKVVSVNDFNWLKHPKHTCNVNTFYKQPIHGKNDNYCNGSYSSEQYVDKIREVMQECKKVNADFMISFNQVLSTLPYAFEYIGNTGRLVITPLTLKIYSTISQAQAMHSFCSASGPAGSGKTETSKQVTNKELGLVNIVFNCSEGLDLIGIRRMLSGVISTGGAIVMDEINRLSLDVLSVFAQMILGIQRGLQLCGGSLVKPAAESWGMPMAHIETTKIVFEGTELNLNSTSTVIITMNPNYSGRQKLPANLVALFRSVSVMVPNYMKICQIRLYSYGFKKATSLAQKAVSVFKLCSEELSIQNFYDYGMRAINSTIQAAGNLREQLGQMCTQEVAQIPKVQKNGELVPDPSWYTEDQIVLRAITEVNLPKFLLNDALLFNNILKDLFPGVQQPFIDYQAIIRELKVVLNSNKMQYLVPTDEYIEKVVDLYMTINLRHGLITLGPALAGKTQSIHALAETMNRLNKQEQEQRLVKFNKLVKQSPDLPLTDIPQYIPEDYQYMKYSIITIDPKSVTLDQLFGQFDAVSKEWCDGILSTQIRVQVADYNKHLAYIEQNLFNEGYVEGPESTIEDVNPEVYVNKANYTREILEIASYIDSVWIESLNSVLDDSKRLTLNNGEIIALSPVMNLVFNTDSVAEASPATISRCGMLYYGGLNIQSINTTKEAIGQLIITGPLRVEHYISTWINRLPDEIRLSNPDIQKVQSLKTSFESRYDVNEEYSEIVIIYKELFAQYIERSIAYIKVNCKQLQEVQDANLILSLFKLIDTFIKELKPNDFGLFEKYEIEILKKYSKPIFVFSLVWSVGSVIGDEQSRLLFSTWLRSELDRNETLKDCPIPHERSLFDYEFKYDPYDKYKEVFSTELEDGKQIPDIIEECVKCFWTPWGVDELENIDMDQLMVNGNKSLAALEQINLAEIIVPTTSNITESYLLQRLLSNGCNTMIVGETGTAKTSVVKNYLFRGQDVKTQIPINITFSANTQAGDLMEYVDSKLEKRRRGVFGPMSGKKYILYVDDLNMPSKEKYGCVNSHELLKELIYQGGWYDIKEIEFKHIIDTYVVTSMVESGGARSAVTERLVSEFNVLNFLELSNDVLAYIYNKITSYWGSRVFDTQIVGEELNEEIISHLEKCVACSISIYNNTREGLLPTPDKLHYTFNLRDLSKVFEGFLMIDTQSLYLNIQETQKAGDKVFNDINIIKSNIAKLFVHENLRVYSDRLINHEDEIWFSTMMDKEYQKTFGQNLSQALNNENSNDLVYGDFIPIGSVKGYEEVSDFSTLNQKLVYSLQEYGEISGQPMNLVLFKTAVEHLARIVRVLREPNSNMLLIGLGGTGRQSLTKLATSCLKYETKTIELKKGYSLKDWAEDIKEMLLDCGIEQKQIVFMLSDQHIFNDKQLEDISILLNTCDLQYVFEQTDLEEIYDKMKPVCAERGLQPTKINLYDCFITIVKKNIHIVLCFSPSGNALRQRLRKFPALINCCAIDYIFSWPKEALYDVARQSLGFEGKSDNNMISQENTDYLAKFLAEQEALEEKPIEQLQNIIVEYCVYIHNLIESYSKVYFEELQRHNQITPTLFLNLLSFLIIVIKQKFESINTYKQQLSSGLEKLQETQSVVTVMEQELTELEPQLVESSKKVDEMMVTIENDTEEANEAKSQADVEQQEAAAKLAECQAIEADAERDLAQAEPLLDAAMTVLNSLSKGDFSEMGSYANPAIAIRQCMESICILLQIKPKRVADPNKAGAFLEDYWQESKKILSNSEELMQNLKNFDKEHIPEQVIKKLEFYIKLEDFTPQIMKTKSQAASGLCAFAIAMYKFYFINLEVIPKRQKLAKAEAELEVVEQNLAQTNAKVAEIENQLAILKQNYQEAIDDKNSIDRRVGDTAKRLDRAETLISSLSGEQTRWEEELQSLDNDIKNLLGDSLYAASAIIYQGAFTSDFRQRIAGDCVVKLRELQVPCSDKNGTLELTDIMSDQVTLMGYCNQNKLPSDIQSMQNAVILFNSVKYTLCIDPEGQALIFLKNYFQDQQHEIIKANDKDLLRNVENCIRFGKVLIICNVQQEIDPALNVILDEQYVKDGNQLCVKLGDSLVPYNSNFKLFLLTNLNNPNYSPEQFVKLTVINFAITQIGLQEQLLGVLVTIERPDQEALKNSLLLSNSKNKEELKQLEQQVLQLLSTSEGDILQNEQLIETLARSQKTSAEIKVKVKESEQTEAEIDVTRKQYIPMARRAAIMYFCIQDLVKIEFMYEYSLNWYIEMYNQSILETEQADDLHVRIENLIQHFTLYAYQCVCRSLFEAHKLLFAFLVAVRILLQDKQITGKELRYLLIGNIGAVVERPPAEFVTTKAWQQICGLEDVSPAFINIEQTFANSQQLATWRQLFESNEPETQPLPEPYESHLTPFERFLPLVALRPDRFIAYLRIFIEKALSAEFTEPQILNLEKSFKDSNNVKPLLFLLNDMADPIADLMAFADTMRMGRKMEVISLGRGVEKTAISLIQEFAERGNWAVLQNCHLCVGFLGQLQQEIDHLQEDPEAVHRDFRLWLTSQPSEQFPVGILQNSVKISVENPNNLKSNLLRVWNSEISEKILNESCENVDKFKALTYSLSMFYSVLLQRKKYGAIGFNTPYAWNTGDIAVCIEQLAIFLNNYKSKYPYEALMYLFSQINLGGCVTDSIDQKTVDAIAEDFLVESAAKPNYVFALGKVDKAASLIKEPTDITNFRDYIEYIEKEIPIDCAPENIGLNSNSDITAGQNESAQFLKEMLIIEGAKLHDKGGKESTKGGNTKEASAENNDISLAENLLAQLPEQFNIDEVTLKYPTSYEESLNSLLVQECGRYNVLINEIESSLKELIKALKGLTLMSPELEGLLSSIQLNRIPEMYEKCSFPSLKPMSSYMKDLQQRIKFLNNWIISGKPNVYCISSFFFAEGFLTSLMQNYARKYSIAIDTVEFRFELTDKVIDDNAMINNNNTIDYTNEEFENGTLISGLYMEAARYNSTKKLIEEAAPRELYYKMPIFVFIPTNQAVAISNNIYECPCYRTLARFGLLSTTGHSTNFLLFINIPCEENTCRHWIKRSVALFANLSD